ncbi:MAG TPA: PilZ domain-containing protein [Tepidisphaeraceae bacterium]|jgi:c-di-GMP-binding flagellar brake protein YcgR
MKLPLREFADIVAALKGPAAAKADSSEIRQAARMDVTAKVNVYFVDSDKPIRSYSALTRDVSLTGMGLLQSVAVPAGQELFVALPRTSGPPLFVQSQAKHCRSLADGLLAVGLEFTKVADDATSAKLIKHGQDQQARIQRSVLG